MSEKSTNLFHQFLPPSYEEWVEATIESLKGRPFSKLTSQTVEDIAIRPFYTQKDIANLPHLASHPGQPPYQRGSQTNPRPWFIAQHLPYATPQQFNRALRDDMHRGQTAVLLDLSSTAINDLPDLTTALDGIVFSAAPIFIAGKPSILQQLTQFIAQNSQLLNELQGGLFNDPLAKLVRHGSAPLEHLYEESAKWVAWANDEAPDFTTMAVNTAVYHSGGANGVQELAFALATAVHHIRTLQKQGLDINQIGKQLRFIFAIGGDFFMEIAKLRAARLLWTQVVEAFGGDVTAQQMKIHGETAVFNKSRLDPYINMLRTSTETLAAAVGGVDSLTVVPFNQPFTTEADEFSRRISRNQQIILQEEADLSQLIDPAGGSYYVEWLTDQLAQKAWALFQEIEKQGGMLAALKAGLAQKWVEETAVARATNLAKRKDVLVGVNQYPDVGAANSNRCSVFNEQSPVSSLQVTPIKPIRLAEPFEALRDWADKYVQANGRSPQIFLANMGSLGQHKARADFVHSFFEVGGFEMISSDGFETVEDAAKGVLDSGVTAVVICSTDDSYPEIVPPLVQSIKSQQPEVVVMLAGYPKEQIEAHKIAGIDAFIHLGANCLALNQWLQSKTER
ncbi:MAG: methylmalonyl-CoA mutase [Chloroflexi bacterium]|nr:methylmalonyl-CoA mutase [Chloroflexota bacterium]